MKMLSPSMLTRGEYARNFLFWDDFESYASGSSRWTLTTTSGGTFTTVSTLSGGIFQLNPNAGVAANNDDGNLYSTNDICLPAADKPFYLESRIGYTEAATNVAAVACGFMSSCGLNTIVDGGATVRSSFTGATFFKKKGNLFWSVVSSIGTSQTYTDTNVSAPGDGSYATLAVEMNPVGSIYEVTYLINGNVATDTSNRRIKHYITLGSPAAMRPNLSVKNGSGVVQVVNIDYFGVQGLR